jgi:hypothetical protein
VRAGRSGALVVRREAGIGKTALLGYAIDSASDLRIMRAVGVESEMELAFAALHQLCMPMLGRLDGLPGPSARCAADRVRAEPVGRAGSVPGGIGGAEPVVGRGGGAAAPPLLLRAAKRLEPLDVGLARATYLEALAAAQFAGRFAVDGIVVEVATPH